MWDTERSRTSLEVGCDKSFPFLEPPGTSTSMSFRRLIKPWSNAKQSARRYSQSKMLNDEIARDSDASAARRWEEYCGGVPKAEKKNDCDLKDVWLRLKEDFSDLVSDVLKSAAAGISRSGFLWGNLGGGMFAQSYFKAAQAQRKDY